MTVTTDTITEITADILAKVLGLTEPPAANTLLHDDLAADSLDAVEIMIEIERAFDIEVIDEDGPWELETVADIADFVRRVAAQQGAAL